jgi:hypothetical protein
MNYALIKPFHYRITSVPLFPDEPRITGSTTTYCIKLTVHGTLQATARHPYP